MIEKVATVIAKSSDVAVIAVGRNELTCKENEDTDNLDLVGDHEKLINVKNTGTITGEQVVELYIHDVLCSVTRPIKELKALAELA